MSDETAGKTGLAHDMASDLTRLDAAHCKMMAEPENDAARLRYFAALADGMLYLMLEREAEDGQVVPKVLHLEEGPVVLAYDLEERLAEAAGAPVPYAELPGRVIAGQLAGQEIALGINLGVADSAFLIPPEALEWLSQTLAEAPVEVAATPVAFFVPQGLPEMLLQALDGKLARASGLAESALIAGVRYRDGRKGHMLAFVGAQPGAEPALARAASEALTFSGVEAGEMDVTFLSDADPALDRMARVALRFDLPKPQVDAPDQPRAPGSDPKRPPILR